MKALVIKFIKFYQKTLSPNHGLNFFGYLSGCRFYPSCSEYSIMAIDKFGFWKGASKSFLRILKCGPWMRGGVDLP